jgi:aquaporin Z
VPDQQIPAPLPTPQPAVPGWHVTEWACELVGTALLLLGGTTAVVIGFAPHSPLPEHLHALHWRLLVTGLLFAGAGSLVTISPLGRRSGAHLNPAMTLAFWLDKHVHWHDLVGYVAAQFVGALGGASLAVLLWRHTDTRLPVHYATTTPGSGVALWTAFVVEAAMTAALVLLVFAFVASPLTARWTPLAVWILVAVLVDWAAPTTGTSLNPARTFGPDLLATDWRGFWVYVVAPCAGAAVAVLVWHVVPGRVLTAKLFHDSRYASTLRTHLPAMPAGSPKNPDVPSKPAQAQAVLAEA